MHAVCEYSANWPIAKSPAALLVYAYILTLTIKKYMSHYILSRPILNGELQLFLRKWLETVYKHSSECLVALKKVLRWLEEVLKWLEEAMEHGYINECRLDFQ